MEATDDKAELDYALDYQRYCKINNSTPLTKAAFRKSLIDIGLTLDDKLFNEKFIEYDKDNNNTIDEPEFIRFCKKELDDNKPRKVVIKFMQVKEQFTREQEARTNNSLDPRYVVGVIKSFNGDTDQSFTDALTSYNFEKYKYAIVMPKADRNLDAVFRSERPNQPHRDKVSHVPDR